MNHVKSSIAYYCLVSAFIGSTLQLSYINDSGWGYLVATAVFIWLVWYINDDLKKWQAERNAEATEWNRDNVAMHRALDRVETLEAELKNLFKARKKDLDDHAAFTAKTETWLADHRDALQRVEELEWELSRRPRHDAADDH